jgi:hypothetical protein
MTSFKAQQFDTSMKSNHLKHKEKMTVQTTNLSSQSVSRFSELSNLCLEHQNTQNAWERDTQALIHEKTTGASGSIQRQNDMLDQLQSKVHQTIDLAVRCPCLA